MTSSAEGLTAPLLTNEGTRLSLLPMIAMLGFTTTADDNIVGAYFTATFQAIHYEAAPPSLAMPLGSWQAEHCMDYIFLPDTFKPPNYFKLLVTMQKIASLYYFMSGKLI